MASICPGPFAPDCPINLSVKGAPAKVVAMEPRTEDLEHTRWREQMIREEIQTLSSQLVRVMEWGVTVLATIQTALYFLRTDMLANLHRNSGGIEQLPLGRYLLGTAFLTVLAAIFYKLSRYIVKRLRHYRGELARFGISTIKEPEAPRWGKWFVALLYFCFPIFDLLLRGILQIEVHLRP